MTHDHFERYHCQIALPGFGKNVQRLLQNARVLIVGAGGLGCPAAQYLAAAGIGTIGIADDDVVSVSNLHRQVLYTPQDVGLPKVEIASKKLQQQNPGIVVIPYNVRVTSMNVMDLIAGFDLVIEGADNFETKYLLNDACVLSGKPLVYGAIYQYEGQVSVWNVLQEDGSRSPNYRDVFPNAATAEVPNCAEGGVIPTLAGMVGCMQANEAIKFFSAKEKLLTGKLWILNVQEHSSYTVRLKKQTAVQITGLPPTISTIDFDSVQKMAAYQFIDVRSETEHQDFNIGGKNIPLEILANNPEVLSSSMPVVFYCASGRRSAAAARIILNRFPQATVYSLEGGLQALKKTSSV
ncbi:HesA/MoeB/ThiF family protein [Niabella sp. CC-SYL272]|uniref:HesA/MoeB/ThiF family protein n=1 Tax=Niabella agricola TaxID=2891571 RepID=UPI001F3EBC5F|nr:HesA/MoeB/ThiF family protein [Niabella agricola]MCF3110653.1 HesA/MoeB/ThiF family protein [Niabella agricola]